MSDTATRWPNRTEALVANEYLRAELLLVANEK
jgi:hypothetical protein